MGLGVDENDKGIERNADVESVVEEMQSLRARASAKLVKKRTTKKEECDETQYSLLQ